MNQNPNRIPQSGESFDSNNNIVNWIDKILNFEKTLNASLGLAGGIKINDTNWHQAPPGKTIFAIKVIAEIVVNEINGDIDLDGETIAQSDIIYGDWESIRLTSGTAIIYYKDV